jgi:DNA-binding transcriptional MerR regulator
MKMIEQRTQEITEYLQKKEVQERIQKSMQEARAKATVTISQAANLFGFSESQLREWEKRGLLSTERLPLTRESKGHRQFSPDVLDKLAIIKELKDYGGFSPGAIPKNVDTIWDQTPHDQNNTKQDRRQHSLDIQQATSRHTPIDKRVEQAEKEVFWKYFTSQALRLSLILACESIPDTVAGLVLPLRPNTFSSMDLDPHRLSEVGECLIGWLDLNGSFYTFLDSAPSFEVPSDFRIQPLATAEENIPQDNTLIVVQRKAKSLNLSEPAVEAIRSLLKPVYKNIDLWRSAFDYGMRDWLYQATDFSSSLVPFDDVLNSLAGMVIQIGGKTSHRKDNWRFCCLLLPDDDTLPLQQRKLIVRAQSERSPYKVGASTVSSEFPGLSLRAYQSGSVIYRQDMSVKDNVIAYHDKEESTRSAIAIPLAGEDGLSIAALYIASDEINAFPIEKQRVLRMICNMAEELLMTYSARHNTSGKLTDLIESPGIVDSSFKKFKSENDFIEDVETVLMNIGKTDESKYGPEEEVSFLAIDIDKQSNLATKYGDRVARNLSLEVGVRLLGHLNTFFTNAEYRRLYHVNADRYYLLLNGMPLEEARIKAEQIRVALEGEYSIDAQRAMIDRPTLPDDMLDLPEVTVRLGVPAFKYIKLKQLLGRFSKETAISEVRAIITNALDHVLIQGRQEGGNTIICWDYEAWGYRKWTPPEP